MGDFSQEIQTSAFTQAVVEQEDVILVTAHLLQCGIIGHDPFQVITYTVNIRKEITGNDIIVFVILYQQYPYSFLFHMSLLFP